MVRELDRIKTGVDSAMMQQPLSDFLRQRQTNFAEVISLKGQLWRTPSPNLRDLIAGEFQ
jgi:hypothetical protein